MTLAEIRTWHYNRSVQLKQKMEATDIADMQAKEFADTMGEFEFHHSAYETLSAALGVSQKHTSLKPWTIIVPQLDV